MTALTRPDQPAEPETPARSDLRLWVRFLADAVIVIAAGFAVTRAVVTIAEHTGMNHTLAGGLFTAVATSLPELVTSVAAVRRGALTLAVAAVIGGNCFDTLFAAVSDLAYREGSLYHAAIAESQRELVLISVSILMTAVLLLGLLRRQEKGPGGIGFESLAVLGIYVATLGLLAMI